MRHEEADQTQAVERYLLGDMTLAEVEQFEDHLFTCPECADSVKTGAVFVENTRAVFKETAPEAATERPRRTMDWKPVPWWKMFMFPAFAPALAVLALLCVVGYQQLLVIPRLRSQLAEVTAPQPLAFLRAACRLSRGAAGRLPCLPMRIFSTCISMWRSRALRVIVVPSWIERVRSGLRTIYRHLGPRLEGQ